MEEKKTNNRTVGITFLLMGLGVSASLGMTVGFEFIPAGVALAIVGLVYLLDKGEGE